MSDVGKFYRSLPVGCSDIVSGRQSCVSVGGVHGPTYFFIVERLFAGRPYKDKNVGYTNVYGSIYKQIKWFFFTNLSYNRHNTIWFYQFLLVDLIKTRTSCEPFHYIWIAVVGRLFGNARLSQPDYHECIVNVPTRRVDKPLYVNFCLWVCVFLSLSLCRKTQGSAPWAQVPFNGTSPKWR